MAPPPMNPIPVIRPWSTRARSSRPSTGTVTDVDDDGEVTVKTDGGEFEIRLTPSSVRQIREGDNVVIEATISPGTEIR